MGITISECYYTSLQWPGFLPFVSQGCVQYIHVKWVCFPHATNQSAAILTRLSFGNFLFLIVKITSLKPNPLCSVFGHEEGRARLCVDTVFLWGKQIFNGYSWVLTNQKVWVFKKKKVLIKQYYTWSKLVWKMGWGGSLIPTWDFEWLLFLFQSNFNCTKDCQHR